MASSLPLPDEVRSLAGSAAVKTPCWTKFWTRSNSTRFQLTLRILRELPSKEVLRLRRLNRFFSKLCWDRSLWRLVSIGVGIEPHDDGDSFTISITRRRALRANLFLRRHVDGMCNSVNFGLCCVGRTRTVLNQPECAE
jgi:hypothetical protein